MFNPGLKIGQIIKNADIVGIFKCGNMGGMRRSRTTNTLVIVSDYTKGLYHDKWIGGVLHYTGMGKSATNGDTPQSLFNQIRTCVHAPLISANPTLDELLDERGREFFDENWRRNDLIRFGEYERDWGFKNIVNPTAKTKLTNRIFPLPQSILDTNTNWNQNDGY